MEVPHVAAVRNATGVFLTFLARSRDLIEGWNRIQPARHNASISLIFSTVNNAQMCAPNF